MNVLRLWQIADRRELSDKADAIFRALGRRLTRSPGSMPQLAATITFGCRSRGKSSWSAIRRRPTRD